MAKFSHLIIVIILPALLFAKTIMEQAEDVIHEEYSGQIDLEFQKFQLNPDQKKSIENTCRQRFYKNFVYLWKISIKGSESPTEYAVLDNVRGKSALITVLSIFSGDAALKSVHIIRYKGEHGREIMNHRWLKKFNGFDKNTDYAPGKSVDTVSGATISSYTLIKGIHKWSLLVDSFISSDN